MLAGTVLFLISCKKPQDQRRPFYGKWNLINWGSDMIEGTLVFKDSTAYFNMEYQTEISRYHVNKDTFRAERIGGTAPYLTLYDYWLIHHIDSVKFKMVSPNGHLITAYKRSKFNKMMNPSQTTDTVSIRL